MCVCVCVCVCVCTRVRPVLHVKCYIFLQCIYTVHATYVHTYTGNNVRSYGEYLHMHVRAYDVCLCKG